MGILKNYLGKITDGQASEAKALSKILTEFHNGPKMSFVTDEEFSDYLLMKQEENCQDCTLCELHYGRQKVCFGFGNTSPEIVIVSDYPESECDDTGQPFVNTEGSVIMEKLMDKAGIDFESVYVTSSVMCMPSSEEDVGKRESKACQPRLLKQLEALHPKYMILMGKSAARLCRTRAALDMDGFVPKCDWPLLLSRNYVELKRLYSIRHPREISNIKDRKRKKRALKNIYEILKEISELING